MAEAQKILVIRHGALGDFILSTGPMKAIRNHHKDAHITLLTRKPFDDLAIKTGYFNEVWLDERPKPWNIPGIIKLAKRLRGGNFNRVYDLQTSRRSASYLRLFCGQDVEWSGISKGASHRHNSPERTKMHTVDRQREQLRIAGINDVGPTDLSWLKSDIKRFGLPEKFALLVPGCSPAHPQKRWSNEGFAEVARWLNGQGVTPVFIGSDSEEQLVEDIKTACGCGISLVNRTSIEDIAALARNASVAVGNDTGPMHIIAAADCPSLMLFSGFSNPRLARPQGSRSKYMQKDRLSDLGPKEVVAQLKTIL